MTWLILLSLIIKVEPKNYMYQDYNFVKQLKLLKNTGNQDLV